MAKFDDKATGNQVSAEEYNNIVRASRNAIENSGQTIDSSNDQLSKALANYTAVSSFYTDSGSANAYILSSISNFQAPDNYYDGMIIRFRTSNANTGSSTVNVSSLGVKDIKKADGSSDLNAGDIGDSYDTYARYDGTVFRLINLSDIANLNVADKVNFARKTATISSGAITYDGAYMRIDTEGAASSDELDTINGGAVGDILILEITNALRHVVIKYGTGNIWPEPNRDLTIAASQDKIIFICDGSEWRQIARSVESTGDFLYGDYIRIANSSFDLSHDISTSSGVFYFDDGTGKAYLATIRKRIDASWAAGTGNGGRDTGSLVANTTYHFYAIYNPTTNTADAIFSSSLSPTLPSGYTKKCRLGSFRTDGSANIIRFEQVDSKTFLLRDQVLDWNENPFSGSDIKALSIPDDLYLGGLLDFTSTDTDNVSETVYGLVSSPLVDDNAASASNNNWFYSHLGGNYRNNSSGNGLEIATDNNRSVRVAFSGVGSSNYRIITRGWVDYYLQRNR